MQRFGLKEGIPFTTYWQGCQAKVVIEKFLTDKLTVALGGVGGVQDGSTVIGLLLQSLAEEGLDISANTEYVCIYL